MNITTCFVDKKITNYYKKLSDIEKKYFINFVPTIDLDKYEQVKKKIVNYKFITNLLYSNPEFYFELKEIELDFTRSFNELSCQEIIWLNQHYEFIEEIKSSSAEITQLIKFAKKYQLISFVQYKLIKKILPKINAIFNYDKSMEHLYSPKENLILYLTMDEIGLFYNILDIIIVKIDCICIKKSNINHIDLFDLAKISTDYQYTNLTKKLNLNLKKIYRQKLIFNNFIY